MTDKELFGNKCPYNSKECQNDWDCHNCKVEEEERQFMKIFDDYMKGEQE